MDYTEIEHSINKENLRCCGGFYPEPADKLDPSILTVVIVGNTSEFWTTFGAAKKSKSNPLEDWTRNRLMHVAKNVKAEVLFPFDGPPYIPIQNWAQRAETLHPSPFGLLIHPKLGLWHAYRGILLFDHKIILPEKADSPSPCLSCVDQPCLTSCPVKAVQDNEFDVTACTNHLAIPEGTECMTQGCLARRACPIGQDYTYSPVQSEFHLSAFLKTFGPN